MKIALVLTNDWELFGDGSGDFFEIQQKPLNELFSLLEEYDAKITLMAEVYQQLKHKEYSQKSSALKQVYEAWEESIKKTINLKHDVQLHIHPQWKDAIYKNGEWKLSNQWSIASMETDSIFKTLQNGKSYLESVLQQESLNYRCIAFRAGAYYIEPSEKVIENLIKAGFKCDTSVTKGLYNPSYYDFREAYSNIIPWFVSKKSIKYSDYKNKELLEMPIYSEYNFQSLLLKKFAPKIYYYLKHGTAPAKEELQWSNERDIIKNKRYPKERRLYKKNEKRDLKWYLKTILSKQAIQLDYDYIPATVFVKMLEKILKNSKLEKNIDKEFIPVIASGHTKDMHNCNNIRKIFEIISNKYTSQIEYWTLTKAINYWLNNS